MGYISEIRKIVGHRPIMVTAATCILFDAERRELLLEKRADNGMWCVPGGAIELGETLEQALRREVKEETALDIENPKLFDIKSGVHMVYPNQDEVYYTDVVYVVTEYRGDPKPDAESTELRWISIDRLPDNFLPTQVDYIEKFVAAQQQNNRKTATE